jgi:hypothetical protein
MSNKTLVNLAKEIKALAKETITKAKKTGGYWKHRSIEIVTADADGRVSDEPYFLELKEISGKSLGAAFKELAEDSEEFTEFGITGGLDYYDTLADYMSEYGDYEPWAETWDLEISKYKGAS